MYAHTRTYIPSPVDIPVYLYIYMYVRIHLQYIHIHTGAFFCRTSTASCKEIDGGSYARVLVSVLGLKFCGSALGW